MSHLLEIDSLIKSFGTRQLLTDVYLGIRTGDVIGLFGRNGTGKSVFLRILFGAMKADRKFIRLDSEKILRTPFEHPGTVAYLPQQSYLPKHEKVGRVVRCYLKADAIPAFCEDDTIQSRMNLRVSQLSGGERRYIEAKLLLFSDVNFVLLDEPFDYLSVFLVDKLIECIRQQSRHKGIVLTDHHYGKVLEVANRLTLLREGTLMELTDKQGLVEQGYLPPEAFVADRVEE